MYSQRNVLACILILACSIAALSRAEAPAVTPVRSARAREAIRSFRRSAAEAAAARARAEERAARKYHLTISTACAAEIRALLAAQRSQMAQGRPAEVARIQAVITAAKLREKSERQAARGRYSFSISAAAPWQRTIRVVAGSRLSIAARGRWSLLKGAAGIVGPDGKRFPWVPGGGVTGYLQGKIGRDGKPFQIGSSSALTPEKTGWLYMGMHNTGFAQNAGALRVRVSVR